MQWIAYYLILDRILERAPVQPPIENGPAIVFCIALFSGLGIFLVMAFTGNCEDEPAATDPKDPAQTARPSKIWS